MEAGKWVQSYSQLHSKSEVSIGYQILYLNIRKKKYKKQNKATYPFKSSSKRNVQIKKRLCSYPPTSSIYFHVCGTHVCAHVFRCTRMYVFLDWSSKSTLECPLYFPKQVSVTSQLDLLIPPVSRVLDYRGLHAHLAFMWLPGSDSGPQLAQQALSQPNSSVFKTEGKPSPFLCFYVPNYTVNFEKADDEH